jgi:hypothetical protein
VDDWIILLLPLLLGVFFWSLLEVLDVGLEMESGSGAAFLRPNILVVGLLQMEDYRKPALGGSVGTAQTQPFHVRLVARELGPEFDLERGGGMRRPGIGR